MGIIEKYISELVFKKTKQWDFNEITLSAEKIFVLSEIDGQKMLKDICENLKITLTDIKNIINELAELNLISILKTSEKTQLFKEGVEATFSDQTLEKETAPHIEKPEPKKTRFYRGVSYEIA